MSKYTSLVPTKDLNGFFELRELVFRGIRLATEEDGACKSYEGSMDIGFPNYFDSKDSEYAFSISLDCYVLGPNRHYIWHGRTLGECVKKAKKDVFSWLATYEDIK